jgi:hypothetical protein
MGNLLEKIPAVRMAAGISVTAFDRVYFRTIAVNG